MIVIDNPDDFSLTSLLTDDLRRPEYRGNSNPMAGHCYVASEVLYHLGYGKPMFIRHENEPHWFTMLDDGTVLDPTASQFSTPVPYAEAKCKGFLTKQPSKRAQKVLEAMNVRQG